MEVNFEDMRHLGLPILDDSLEMIGIIRYPEEIHPQFHLYRDKMENHLKYTGKEPAILRHHKAFKSSYDKFMKIHDYLYPPTDPTDRFVGGKLHGINAWISHVKAYQAKHGCSYKEALQKSKATYKKGSGFFEDFMKSQKTEEPRFETGGASLERRRREEKAAIEAADMAERMASLPKKPDGRIYAGMRKGGSISSLNKAYWKANRDLFNATYGPMS